jgi:lysophospholipase L1-like esterase
MMNIRIAVFSLGLAAWAQSSPAQDHWVDAWAAAQQTPRAVPQAAAPAPAGFNNQTVRMIVRSGLAGRRIRVELANTYGTAPLGVGAAHIAVRSEESGIVPQSDQTLLVNGKPSFTIPPGALVVSDPLDFNVPRLADLAVSLYIPGSAPMQTQHSLGLHTTYISKEGDFAAKASIPDATTSQAWYWLSSIAVLAPAEDFAVVAYGDSITDGFRSTPDTNHMWPAVLAQRAPQHIAVINEAISGNQILRDGAGVNALARFDHDVLTRRGVRFLMILEGINDIGRGTGPAATPATAVTAEDVIGGLRQMVERAHMQGIKVIGATLTPYEGAAYFSEKGETVRSAVNAWIRTGGAYDGVVDFDAATRNPDHQTRFREEFDSGDHLHPNDAGYKAMAESIDLAIFGGRTK